MKKEVKNIDVKASAKEMKDKGFKFIQEFKHIYQQYNIKEESKKAVRVQFEILAQILYKAFIKKDREPLHDMWKVGCALWHTSYTSTRYIPGAYVM